MLHIPSCILWQKTGKNCWRSYGQCSSHSQKWKIDQSPLYRHIEKKEVDQAFGRMLQKLIIQLLQTDEEMQFLKDSTEWEAWTNI